MGESVKQTKQLQARRQNTDTFTLTYAYVLFLYIVVYFVCVWAKHFKSNSSKKKVG